MAKTNSTLRFRNHWGNKVWLLIAIVLAIAALAFYFAPIKQSRNFYDYADQRIILGIPHFWDVISNLPFLLVGLLGLWQLEKRKQLKIIPACRTLYQAFFCGLIATFLGSGYYHLTPDAFSLMLDRIPLSITFIALYCVVLSEYVSPKAGVRLLLPLFIYGVLSVVYWYIGESVTGRGDLSAYILIQLVPILHLPLILWLFRSQYSHGQYYMYALLAYLASKWAESNDDVIYDNLGVLSGHSIKHLLAGLGGFLIYTGWKIRSERIGPKETPRGPI